MSPHCLGQSDRARDLLRRAWKERPELWRPSASARVSALPVPIESIVREFLSIQLDEFEDDDLAMGSPSPKAVSVKLGGYCDRLAQTIGVAARLPTGVRRFTIAHELGHWLLHDSTVAFREMAINGHESRHQGRSPVEREADLFAAEILMPEKQIRAAFGMRFGTNKIVVADLDEEFRDAAAEALQRPVHLREFYAKDAYFAAMAAGRLFTFRGRAFQPLFQLFGVSSSALGARLAHLGLVRP